MQHSSKQLIQIISFIKEAFQSALLKAFPDIKDSIAVISLPYNNKFNAEYQSSTGIKLFNQYKKEGSLGCQTANEISEKILNNLDRNQYPYIGKCIVNQQGFINISLANEFLEDYINLILREGIHMNSSTHYKFAVDFSSPDISKDIHIGILRCTIVGESICRILEECGHEVLRINHLGDWGTQFGISIERLKEVYPNYLQEKPNLIDLQAFHREAQQRYNNDPAFKKRAQLNVAKFQKYEEQEYKAWEIICNFSRRHFNTLYQRLDIKAEQYGESFYNDMIPDTLNELRDKGLIVLDNGAQCIFVKEGSIPLMVVKSDGGYNYDTTDMTAIRYRLNTLNCNRLIYCFDIGQEAHFKLIFGAAKKAAWLKEPQQIAYHMGVGLVLGLDGQKMKDKNGDNLSLNALLDQVKMEVMNELRNRQKEQLINLKEEEFEKISEIIAIGAVKYNDLKQTRTQNYKFDIKKLIDHKGNTAVYLFYSYVRICSIIKKSQYTNEEFNEFLENGFKITHDAERDLINIMIKFQDVVENITYDLEIHKLADFLYALATKLSESYQKYKILGEKETKTRLLLCLSIKMIMEKALYMLGIKTIDKF